MTPASDLLREEHRRIESHLDPMLDALQHLTPERVADVRSHFQAIQSISRVHFRREEEIFYPRLRHVDPHLLEEMDGQHEDTRQGERDLEAVLASMPAVPSERDFTELHRLGIFFHDYVQTHILAEEEHLLTLADESLRAEEQQELCLEMQQVKE